MITRRAFTAALSLTGLSLLAGFSPLRLITDAILQRVNRFFGWSAVGKLALRQAPLSRRDRPKPSRAPDPGAVAEVAKTLDTIEDEELRAALARLGASIKRN